MTNLDKILQEKKLSIYWLAQSTHVPYRTMYDIVKGKIEAHKSSFENIFKISVVLKVSMEEVVDIKNVEELKQYTE